MAHRPKDSATRTGTTPSANHVQGSAFDGAAPLRIPLGLPASIRKRVKKILEDNPYLEQAHMAAVVRLAKLEESHRDLQDEVDRDGVTVQNRFGESVANPALQAMLKVQNALVTQERALAIAVPTRKEQISKSELKRAVPKTPNKAGKANTPKLRLA